MRILGATLWTDYLLRNKWLNSPGDDDNLVRLRAMAIARQNLNDHGRIRFGGDVWRPEDALAEHQASVAWLDRKLAEPFEGPTLVVTHHAPLARSVDWSYCGRAAACYASDLDHLVDRASVWMHGHVHKAKSYMHGACRVLSNPRGYPGQLTGWSPRFTFDVGPEGTYVARRRHLDEVA